MNFKKAVTLLWICQKKETIQQWATILQFKFNWNKIKLHSVYFYIVFFHVNRCSSYNREVMRSLMGKEGRNTIANRKGNRPWSKFSLKRWFTHYGKSLGPHFLSAEASERTLIEWNGSRIGSCLIKFQHPMEFIPILPKALCPMTYFYHSGCIHLGASV